MSNYRRRLLIVNSDYDKDIVGVLLKDNTIVPYSNIPSDGYQLDNIVGVTVQSPDKKVSIVIHPTDEQKCYYSYGGNKMLDDFSGIIASNVVDAVEDYDGYSNSEQLVTLFSDDPYSNGAYAIPWCWRVKHFDNLQSYLLGLGEAQYLASVLNVVNDVLLKCNGKEIVNQNYWVSTLNGLTSSNTLNSAWITNFRDYRDGSNVQAIMFVRPVAKIPENAIRLDSEN